MLVSGIYSRQTDFAHCQLFISCLNNDMWPLSLNLLFSCMNDTANIINKKKCHKQQTIISYFKSFIIVVFKYVDYAVFQQILPLFTIITLINSW